MGRKVFTRWRRTKTSKKHKLVKNTQSGRTPDGITLTTGLTQNDGRVAGTDLWTDPWEQAARQLPSTQPAQEQSNPTHGGSISILCGLTVCELSVDDGEQRSEQNEVDRNRCDDWNDRAETWVQNEMTNGHKFENWVQNEMTNGHKFENWVQNEMMHGHKRWNNRIWRRNWIQNKMTGCHKSSNRSWDTN